MINAAEIHMPIIHAQLSEMVYGDHFTGELLLIRTRNSRGQHDNYISHERHINVLLFSRQLVTVNVKCMGYVGFSVVLI